MWVPPHLPHLKRQLCLLLVSLRDLAYIEFARQDRVLGITFVVIEVIKPELQGPDAVGR